MAHARKVKPDVIVADFITPCAFEAAEALNIPVIANMPAPLAFKAIASPVVLALINLKSYLMQPREEHRQASRMISLLVDCMYTKPVLWHSFFGLEPPQPILPNVFVTGTPAPRLPAADAKHTSMPELNDWLRWVRSQGLKIVYVTMGSMQTLDKSQVQAIYNGLNALDCAILWSLKEDQQALLPGGSASGLHQKWFINKWLPQGEALQLPEVALVITHCGWGGLNETINAGKPIVATPFRADQPMNAKVATTVGMAVTLDTKRLRAAAVTSAVATVLSNPTYKERAEALRGVLLRTGGAERCAEVVEQLTGGYDELLSTPPRFEARSAASKLLLWGFATACMVLVSQRALTSWRR